MSRWPSTKAKQVLAALKRKGWDIKRTSGSHRTLQREGVPDFSICLSRSGRDWTPYVGKNREAYGIEAGGPMMPNRVTGGL